MSSVCLLGIRPSNWYLHKLLDIGGQLASWQQITASLRFQFTRHAPNTDLAVVKVRSEPSAAIHFEVLVLDATVIHYFPNY